MFGEDQAAEVQQGPIDEVINNVKCRGYSLVAKTLTGYWLATNGTDVEVISNKETMMEQFSNVYNVKAEIDEISARKDWDDLHLIVIHMPISANEIVQYLDPAFGAVILMGGNSIMGFAGIPVSADIVTNLKAFDLHDDVVASHSLEKQALEEVQQPPLI